MIMQSLRLWLYRQLSKQLFFNKEEDEITFSSVLKDYGSLMIYSGTLMRISPSSILTVIVYNVFLSTVIWASVALIAYSIVISYTTYFTMERVIFSMHLSILLILSGICHSTFFIHRKQANLLYRDLEEAKKYREPDPVSFAQTERVRQFCIYLWPRMVYVVIVSIMGMGPLVDAILQSSDESMDDKLPVPIIFPFDTRTRTGYWSAVAFEALMIYAIVVEISAGLPAYLFVQKIVLELKSLILSISEIYERSLEMYKKKNPNFVKSTWEKAFNKQTLKETEAYYSLYQDPLFIQCYEKYFKDIIIHHQIIVRIFQNYQSYGGIAILFVIGLSSAMIAVSIYCIISDAAGISLKMTTTMLVGLQILNIWVICYYGEQTSSLCEQIRYELHFTNWIHCRAGVKRSLRIMQEKTLVPLNMAGVGFNVKANYVTFSTVINSAYTYINLLFATHSK